MLGRLSGRQLLEKVEGNLEEKSLELSLHAIGLAESGPVEEDYCLSSIYGNVVNCYMTQYSYDEAIEKGEQYIESSRTDRMVKAVIVDKEKYEKALHYTAFYWQVYQEYLKNRDAFMTFDTPVTNTCFHERKRTPVLGNGVRAAVHCGKGDLGGVRGGRRGEGEGRGRQRDRD